MPDFCSAEVTFVDSYRSHGLQRMNYHAATKLRMKGENL